MPISDQNLIWIDLEMTGLSPEYNRIIELATLITDKNLNILAEGPVLAIFQPEKHLKLMDEWNICTHTANGLINRVRCSQLNEKMAEEQTLMFISKWVPIGKSPICGNSIGQDRRFLFRYMPNLEAYFHYRYLEVSTLKLLVDRWKPEILSGFKKKNTHHPLDDIRESVAELSYYRKYFICL
ncbi:oligoribonuclease [Candidatus Curculioniphilus buchneri]|uniref:oligoribonuclease n=1 Tax=Candidatus Curculioniphilus buchneri TaxID=690594 RepID=UPI00376ED829